ncbi:hypothetical protein D9M71_544100 [compost metagenome]
MRQGVEHVAHQQGEDHPAAGEDEALEAGVHRHVLAQQLPGPGGELRPQGEGALEIAAAQRVLFHADEMQLRRSRRHLLEQLPAAEKVQSGAEAGFADHQAPVGRQGGKALGQLVVGEEHVAGFLQARGRGEVHVAKGARQRLALFVPVQLGVRLLGHRCGRRRKGGASILADWPPWTAAKPLHASPGHRLVCAVSPRRAACSNPPKSATRSTRKPTTPRCPSCARRCSRRSSSCASRRAFR